MDGPAAATPRPGRASEAVPTVDQPSTINHQLREAAAIAAVFALGLIVYWRPIVDGYVLLGFDPFVYFYPLMAYRDARLLTGELPLWVPDYFLGAPFLANPQTGVLYAPNWLTAWLDAPRAYAWQALGHALWMALGGYLFARRVLGVGAVAALAAASALAFGGAGQALVGHLNQLQAAAWLPWAALLADQARPRRSWRLAGGLGAVLALQVLAGHAQQSYMTAAALGVWLLGRALVDRSDGGLVRDLVSAAALLGVAGAIAGLLAAPQLLPTLELSGEGIRAGGMSYREAVAFSLPPWMLPVSLLPVYTFADQPNGEWLGHVGVVGALLAALGLVAGRPRPLAWLLAAIGLGALLLGLGQFDPLYPLLYGVVPGLGLFRVPARWLFVYGFATAMLVALGVEALRVGGCARRTLSRLGGFAALAAAPFALYALAVPEPRLRLPGAAVLAAWAALALAGAALVALGLSGWRRAAPVLVVALAFELTVASWPMEVNRAGPPEALASLRPTEAHLRARIAALPDAQAGTAARSGPYRALAITDSGFDPGDLALLRSQVAGLLEPERVEDWVAAVKHKDALTPSLSLAFGIPSIDGYDGGVLPLRSYVGLKELFPLKGPNLPDGRLGIQLERLPPVGLLSWLNVRWVVMDRHRDLWFEGVYYDRAVRTIVPAGGALELDGVPTSTRATALGLLAWPCPNPPEAPCDDPERLAAGPPGDGRPAAALVEVEVVGADGLARGARASLAYPEASGAAASGGGAASDPRPAVRPIRLALGGEVAPRRVVVRVPAESAPVVVSGLTLIDEATGNDWPVPAAEGLRFSALGDVKVYENELARERAFLVHGIRPVADDAAARALLAGGLDPAAAAAVVGAVAALPEGRPEPGEGVEIVAYRPERIELRVTLVRPGLLVLTDADYPGWQATVDGVPSTIRRANGGLRALELSPGAQTVVFEFWPTRFGLGLGLAGVGLVALTLAFGFAGRRPRP
ncbi:MAG TPA: YfhO family protein [Chloroflexota bacterium]|jgi:hypothetical protein